MKRFIESVRPASLACVGLLFLVMNPAAQASVPPAAKQLVRSVRVSYADLDLTRQADVQILLGRIENAAYRACGGDPRRHPVYDLMPKHTAEVFKECRADAVARAVGSIDLPLLSQARVDAAGK